MQILANSCKRILIELESPPTGQFEEVAFNCSTETITAMTLKLKELEDRRSERTDVLKTFAIQIMSLWEMLNISTEEQEQFFQVNSGIGSKVVKAVSLPSLIIY
jgi:hypothetical protein